MKATIGKFDFASIRNEDQYFFIADIDNSGEAILIGMKLSLYKDTIIFFSIRKNIDELSYVTENFVNINGPLSILRENMMKGINDIYIEDYE